MRAQKQLYKRVYDDLNSDQPFKSVDKKCGLANRGSR